MDETNDLHSRAAALRRDGYSYSQIGRRLGVHKSVVARWVVDVPFDGFNDTSRAEQLRAVRDPDRYNRAIELRQAGWSYAMIEAELGVARSTLSGWLRDIVVTAPTVAVRERVLRAQRAAVEANTRKYHDAREHVRTDAREEAQRLLVAGVSDRELFLLGLTLYWAEGSKTHNHVAMANADTRMIRSFVHWATRCLDVRPDQLRATMHLYPDVDIESTLVFWSEHTGIPREQFYKTQIDRRVDKTAGKCGKLPFGTIHVSVTGPGVARLHQRIMGLLDEFAHYLGSVGRD